MDVKKLKEFLIKKVPNFSNPKIHLTEGECFHYTHHWDKINSLNKFKGAKINEDLDQTQNINFEAEASEDIGVVFAYENIKDAREEGFGLDIIKIKYKNAISCVHKAEDNLGKYTSEMARSLGIDFGETNTPPTFLILTSDIISFEFIEKAKN